MCVTTWHWGVPNTRVATIVMSPKIIKIALCTSALTLLFFSHKCAVSGDSSDACSSRCDFEGVFVSNDFGTHTMVSHRCLTNFWQQFAHTWYTVHITASCFSWPWLSYVVRYERQEHVVMFAAKLCAAHMDSQQHIKSNQKQKKATKDLRTRNTNQCC